MRLNLTHLRDLYQNKEMALTQQPGPYFLFKDSEGKSFFEILRFDLCGKLPRGGNTDELEAVVNPVVVDMETIAAEEADTDTEAAGVKILTASISV